jgi:hydroxymethylpyrimidine pyrophosphatase-like HAD family hydrolase
MQKLIALDIDGTVAPPGASIALEVQEYLSSLAKHGWTFFFVTGRAFHFAAFVLKKLPFPYFLATYNGALILEMPSQTVLRRKYLERAILDPVRKICIDQGSGFVIYVEDPFEDLCYFEPALFTPEMLEYLYHRAAAFGERWRAVTHFDDKTLEQFPSIKCFGGMAHAKEIATCIQQQLNLHIPLITDPFHRDYYVAQATHPLVDKGYALQDVLDILSFKGTVIAAGDDYNDLPMLIKANIRIIMETAPLDMQSKADIIAPSIHRHGIIEGLQKALESVKC